MSIKLLLWCAPRRMIATTFDSQQPGQRLDWQELEGCFVLRPPGGRAPEAVVHFLGGAFVGAAPQLSYRYCLLGTEGGCFDSLMHNQAVGSCSSDHMTVIAAAHKVGVGGLQAHYFQALADSHSYSSHMRADMGVMPCKTIACVTFSSPVYTPCLMTTPQLTLRFGCRSVSS